MLIRPACAADAENLLAIYTPYVKKTAITFEYDVPTLSEFTERIENTLKKYPYLVAEENGNILGYAYASPFKARAAYQWAVETTIYLAENTRGRGIGRPLYTALENALREMNILNACACIAYTEKEDETLTNASMRFHDKMGYQLVAHFHQCGYKFGRWYDMIWMEKMLGEHGQNPAEVVAFR